MRGLAKVAGVSICTVSKALRDSPAVKAETRARVRRLAEEHGYRPSPSLSRSVGRRAKSRKGQGDPLALVLHSNGARLTGSLRLLFESAEERARQLGYRLDWVSPSQFASWEEMDRVLWSRGVEGIILGPQVKAPLPGARMRWDRYAAVCVGQPWVEADLPLVRMSYLRAVLALVEELAAIGYRRIGSMIVQDPDNDFQHQAQLAGLSGLAACPPAGLAILPPLLVDREDSEHLGPYLRRSKPEVLIVQRTSAYWVLRERGWQIPEELGLAALYRPPVTDRWTTPVAGVVSPTAAMGREAVNVVDAALRQGVYGASSPREIILPFQCAMAASVRAPNRA